MSDVAVKTFPCPECRTQVLETGAEPRCRLCGTRFQRNVAAEGYVAVGTPARWIGGLGLMLVLAGFVSLALRAPLWQVWLPLALARSLVFGNDLRTGVCAFGVMGLSFWPTVYRDESPARFRWTMCVQGLVLAGFWVAVVAAFRR